MTMMPEDCHAGWAEPAVHSDLLELTSSDESEELTLGVAAQATAAQQASMISQQNGDSVRAQMEAAQGSQVSQDSSSMFKTERGARCEVCAGSECARHCSCHTSCAATVSVDDLDICVSDCRTLCITEHSLPEAAAESDSNSCCRCCSGGSQGKPGYAVCATATESCTEQPVEAVLEQNGAGASLGEIFLQSDSMLIKEAQQVHQCLLSTSVCGSASLGTNENENIAHESSENTHTPDASAVTLNTAPSLQEQAGITLSRKSNSNSNADTESETAFPDAKSVTRSVSGAIANDQANLSLLSVQSPSVSVVSPSMKHEEVGTSQAQHTASSSGGAVTSEHCAGGDILLLASAPTSLISAISPAPDSSIDSTVQIDSIPLISAMSLAETESENHQPSESEPDLPRAVKFPETNNAAAQAGLEVNTCMINGTTINSFSYLPEAPPPPPAELTVDLTSTIPDEVLLKVFSFLKPVELCRHVTLVCRRWQCLAYDGSLWRRLDLSKFRVSGLQLARFIPRISMALRYLDMSGVDDLSVSHMAEVAHHCPQLTYLDLGFVDSLTSPMLQVVLAHCPRLASLNVEGCRNVTNDMMRVLTAHASPHLRRLNFSHCALVDESLALLTRHVPAITHLNIDGISWISEAAVLQLIHAYTSSMESLHLDGNELGDRALQAAARCQRLTVLSISFCEQLTDVCVTHLKRLTKLERLTLRKGVNLPSGALLELLSHPNLGSLTHLDLTECQQMSDACVEAISHTCGPRLQLLDLSWCWDISDSGIHHLATNCPKMVRMILTGLHRLYGTWLSSAISTMQHLVFINFEQCNMVEDNVIEEAVREKPDLVIYNYYGEVFTHAPITD